ncbi:MAG: transport protein RbsD/FucU [Armatimonadetes bacterium]|nr:transport protein RbsD/FucU [Armatimonadota bacterium]
MLQHGIINPGILSLLARVRHTNALVISDRGFPYWPMIETIDISLVDGIPTVAQVLAALRGNFDVVEAYMAEEFRLENSTTTQGRFADALAVPITFEPHLDLKKRVPEAIGLIRTGDTTQYANIVLYSGRPE